MQNMRLKRVVIKNIIKVEIITMNQSPSADMEEIRRNCQSINFSKLLDYIGNEFCVPAIWREVPTAFYGRSQTPSPKSPCCLELKKVDDSEKGQISHIYT